MCGGKERGGLGSGVRRGRSARRQAGWAASRMHHSQEDFPLRLSAKSPAGQPRKGCKRTPDIAIDAIWGIPAQVSGKREAFWGNEVLGK